jgi:alpha-L-fucosidase
MMVKRAAIFVLIVIALDAAPALSATAADRPLPSAPSGIKKINHVIFIIQENHSFDRTVVMEWLNAGQRIQKYDIQAWDGKSWQTLHAGSSLGHKKIDIFPRTTAPRVRLRILMAADSPCVREFQIFDGRP